MELRNLATFVRAAELRSFSQAAKQLGYSQSAISMQISQLETELGTCLFDRIGKTIALTNQGMRFYEYAQNILRMTENAKKVMQNAAPVSGHLRMAIAESLCLSFANDVLTTYRNRYPDVQVTVNSSTTGDMFRALTQNDVDLVCQLDNMVYRSDIETVMRKEAPIYFVASPDHPLAGKDSISLAECLKEPFILTEKGLSYRHELDTQLAQHNMEVQPFLEIGNVEVICQMVENKMGLSFLPEYIVRNRLKDGRLTRLNVEGIDVTFWIQLFYHKGKWITPAMQAMIDTVCDFVQHRS